MARALTSLTLIQIRFNINSCNAEVHGIEVMISSFRFMKNLIEHISALPSTNKIHRTIAFCFHKNPMSNHFRIPRIMAVFLCIISPAGITAAGLARDLKMPPVAGGSFFNVKFFAEGSTVYAGGNQMLVCSWDGTSHWGRRSGTIATMSSDGNYVVSTA
jgi:hypothetical protein